MENAYKLAEKILNDTEEYSTVHVNAEGKDVVTETSIDALNVIIENGFVLYKHCVEKKLFEKDPAILAAVLELEKYIEKLQVTKENADKLRLSNAMQIWNQAKIAIVMLSLAIIENYEGSNGN